MPRKTSQELIELYDYRVSNGLVTIQKPNRYQASAQVASWGKQGFNGEVKAERRVKGEWQEDNKAMELANKIAMKETATKSMSTKEVTIKSTVAEIGKVARLISATDTVTNLHIEAMQKAIEAFLDVAERV